MTKRPDSSIRPHEHFMRLALDEARKAAERGEVPVGAVIVDTRDHSQPATTASLRVIPGDMRNWLP